MKKLVYLEDNCVIRESLSEYLRANNYEVLEAESINKFKSLFIDDADLVLLDVNLPDGDAYSLVEYIKSKEIPIIFLTVRDSDRDIIEGLELGGDDYVTKPFKPEVLKARIESVLRRFKDIDQKFLRVDKLVLDIEGTKVYIENCEINLSQKEYLLLELLFKNIGKTLTREKLIEILWDYDQDFVNDNTLSVTMRRLREKIMPYDGHIKTIRGIGYRMDYEK
ncbi:MAG: response regulator transcription factor [Tissierellia bacterium]|nr:response regulator transcription factor [Tissierellia bacterium]